MREDTNRIKFYPCEHTQRDGLHYSQRSVHVSGRWMLTMPNGTEISIKECCKCAKEHV